jgi:hypothetical protein
VEDLQLPNIAGVSNPAGIQWGGDSRYATASIASVNVERFESGTTSPGSLLEGRGRFYDVVCTVAVTISVRDTALFKIVAEPAGLIAKLRFRLVSPRHVILRQQEEEAVFQMGESSFCTTRFSGLSKGELGKASYISVSWVYGR